MVYLRLHHHAIDLLQFGDLTLWLDKAAKSKAASLTGKDEYEFGDLSRWVDSKVKDKVNDITGKDTYTFGYIIRSPKMKILLLSMYCLQAV